MRDAWPEVLGRLETISRPSWLIATVARVAALEGDILTLTFQSQGDVAAFKKRTAGSGPSEDLRQAIQGVLGIRVKYIARHDSDEPGGDGGPSAPASPPPAPPTASRESGGSSAPARQAPPAPRASAGPVTEWAVATIPTDAPAVAEPSARYPSGPGAGPAASASTAVAAPVRPQAAPAAAPAVAEAPAQFAVDDEPEDAAVAARPPTTPPARDGVVLPPAEVAPSIEPDEPDDPADEETFPIDAPVPPVIAPPVRSAAPAGPPGIQRYGEAVVRQVLGARFVREEPYERPTRFA
jgi:DNA polymerase-3 subunit gamma/tau